LLLREWRNVVARHVQGTTETTEGQKKKKSKLRTLWPNLDICRQTKRNVINHNHKSVTQFKTFILVLKHCHFICARLISRTSSHCPKTSIFC
jgi:hypothetical protein